MKNFAVATLMIALLPGLSIAADADWPQWRGPNRDGRAAPQKLLQSWPSDGPKVSWSADSLGTGYSAVSVVGDQVFTMGSKDGQSKVICLSLADGETVWEQAFGRAGTDDDYNAGWGAGQRGTPTVDGDQIFVLSDIGTVAALDRSSGNVQWSVELVGDHGGKIPTWGYSESPLVDGDRVVVTPGGSDFMIALDRKTGEKVWSSKGVDAPAQYVSVMKGTVGSTTFYTTASKPGIYAFDVQSGEKLFDDPATGNGTAVIPTPIVSGDLLYYTSAYGGGNTLLKLDASGSGLTAESVYALKTKTMENHHGGVVLDKGVIYGFTKQSRGNWMAQDLQSGETLWQEQINKNKSGSICFADNRLYCYNDKDGTVILAKPSRDGWEPQGQLELPTQTKLPRDRGAIWAHPVVANGKLFIRDQDLLYAFDVAR